MASNYYLEDDALASYLKSIVKHKPLSSAEEFDLARRIKKGDARAMHRLISANLKFVVSVAHNYQNQGLPLTDLINEGNMGLIRAAQRFDETKKFRFISYAVWWIRQAILSALADQSRVVRLPMNRVNSIQKVNRAVDKIEQQYHRPADSEEIARALDMNLSEVMVTLKASINHTSLDKTVGADSDTLMIDLVSDQGQEALQEDNLQLSNITHVLKKVLDTLDAREREMIKMYFGIGLPTSFTLDEIGRKFKLTRERVRQIKDMAIKRLKHTSRNKKLREFYDQI